MNSLGNEVAKNIILAGVEHMTILDNTVLTEDEKKIQFLPSTSAIGQNVSFTIFYHNISSALPWISQGDLVNSLIILLCKSYQIDVESLQA